MDKFLDQFAEFPAKYKYLILFTIVAVAIGLFYWLVVMDKHEEIEKLESKLQELQVEVDKAKRIAAKYDEFKEELRRVELELKEALKKLPEGKEIPNLLDQMGFSLKDLDILD